jgi:hypothetical protein
MSIVSLVIAPTLAIFMRRKIESRRKAKMETLQNMPAVRAVHTVE